MKSLKKNLKEIIANNPEKDLYFFDESRFGTHSKLGHGWFRKGTRTQVKTKLGFQNFYLYSAVNPATGEDYTLMTPNVNTEWLNIFLAGISDYAKNKNIILIMDCAGWHKAMDLAVPDNIQIVYLPPYSPELNPSERLWQYIKSETIKNKIYETIERLEDAVCSCVKNLNAAVIKSICSMDYLLN